MNKQEKKIFIVRRLLEIAETINKESGWRSTPHEVTFRCPEIGDYVDGANGVLVKKLERFIPHPTTRNRYTYKLHFVHIKETEYWETDITTWDKMDKVTMNQVFYMLTRVQGDGVQKGFYSLK